jgi:hypothetical protein
MSGGARKLSGLQKEVLALYRNILLEAVKKDRDAAVLGRIPVISLFKASDVGKTSCYMREEFRCQAGTVRCSDFKAIEYRICKGQNQVKLHRMPGGL